MLFIKQKKTIAMNFRYRTLSRTVGSLHAMGFQTKTFRLEGPGLEPNPNPNPNPNQP